MKYNILFAAAVASVMTSCEISVDSSGSYKEEVLNSLTEEYSEAVFKTIRNIELCMDIDKFIAAGGVDGAAGTDYSYVGENLTMQGGNSFEYGNSVISRTNADDSENGGTGLFDNGSQWKMTIDDYRHSYTFVFSFAGDSTWNVSMNADYKDHEVEEEMTMSLTTRSNGRNRLWTTDLRGKEMEDSGFSATMSADGLQTYLTVYDRRNVFYGRMVKGTFNTVFYKDGEKLLERNRVYDDEIPM